jgi:hypothetical protein
VDISISRTDKPSKTGTYNRYSDHDSAGDNEEIGAMPKASKTIVSADDIAAKASRGEDVSAHFTNKFTVVTPTRRVTVDLTEGMLRQLDERAARLNISRQAVIKTLLSRAMEGRPSEPRSAKETVGLDTPKPAE